MTEYVSLAFSAWKRVQMHTRSLSKSIVSSGIQITVTYTVVGFCSNSSSAPCLRSHQVEYPLKWDWAHDRTSGSIKYYILTAVEWDTRASEHQNHYYSATLHSWSKTQVITYCTVSSSNTPVYLPVYLPVPPEFPVSRIPFTTFHNFPLSSPPPNQHFNPRKHGPFPNTRSYQKTHAPIMIFLHPSP